MNILTRYYAKPIPNRNFDWQAIDDDTYDIGQPIGFGRTEAEAVEDLKQQIEDRK